MGVLGLPDGTVQRFRVKEFSWGERPPKYALQPCRECGSEKAKLWYVGAEGFGHWRIICSACHHMSGKHENEEAAVSEWNEGENNR